MQGRRITRRGLIGGAAAGTAVGAIPAAAQAAPKQPSARSADVAVLGPGTLIGFGEALRQPVDRIHWAGTETSTYWNGYMDGAVRSGMRAAAEALTAP